MSHSHTSSFGIWIRLRRKVLGLTQEQLGKKINYSAIAIRKLESGNRPCSEELAGLLAEALEVPVHYRVAFMTSARAHVLEHSLQQLRADELPWASELTLDQRDREIEVISASGNICSAPSGLNQYAQPMTQLFGRETEVAQVLELLPQPFIRLITLRGPPGVGKSRLVAEVLRQVDPQDWPDGKFFVPLTHIDHAALIPNAIAAAMDIRETGTHKWKSTVASQSVFRFLKDKQALLVLDNFAHLANQGGVFLTELIAAAPSIKIIVSSQVSLDVSNEQEYPVNTLKLPDDLADAPLNEIAQNAAVALFVARAQTRRHTFRLTKDNASAIIEICQKLDGLPLALELAAAHLKLQTPAELLAQLKGLSSTDQGAQRPYSSNPKTLRVLNGGAKDMLLRHQTLFASIQWSYNLLTPAAQALFEQLGVFQGGFTRDAALSITPSSIGSLERLASQSLVQVHVTPSGQIRLSLLEIFREFALMKLEAHGEIAHACWQHAQYFLALARGADTGLRGPDQREWLEKMSVEIPNFRAALQWCIEHDRSTGFALAQNLIYFWFVAGYQQEGRTWIADLLEADQHSVRVSPVARAYLLCHAAGLYFGTPVTVLEDQLALFEAVGDLTGVGLAESMLGLAQLGSQPARAERYLIAAIRTLDVQGDVWRAAMSRVFLAVCMYIKQDFAASEKLLDEGVVMQTKLQDWRTRARTQNQQSWLAFVQGKFARAFVLAGQVLELNRQFNDPYGMLEALSNQAFAAIELGQLVQAQSSIDEGMVVSRKSGVDVYQIPLLHVAGALAFAQGNLVEAGQYCWQSLAQAPLQGQTDYIRLNLITLAQIAMSDPCVDSAAIMEWLGAVQSHGRRVGYYFPHTYQLCMDTLLRVATQRLGKDIANAAILRGSEMLLDAAVALAQRTMGKIPIQSISIRPIGNLA